MYHWPSFWPPVVRPTGVIWIRLRTYITKVIKVLRIGSFVFLIFCNYMTFWVTDIFGKLSFWKKWPRTTPKKLMYFYILRKLHAQRRWRWTKTLLQRALSTQAWPLWQDYGSYSSLHKVTGKHFLTYKQMGPQNCLVQSSMVG